MLTIFIVIVVLYHLSPSDDNDINATYIRKSVQKYCDVTFICDLQCYLFYEIYVPSMEVPLQVCNKDQDMEVWIPALFFVMRLGLTVPINRGLEESCWARSTDPLAGQCTFKNNSDLRWIQKYSVWKGYLGSQ